MAETRQSAQFLPEFPAMVVEIWKNDHEIVNNHRSATKIVTELVNKPAHRPVTFALKRT